MQWIPLGMPKKIPNHQDRSKAPGFVKITALWIKEGGKKGRNGVKLAHLGLWDAFLEVLWNLGIPQALGTTSHLTAEKPRVYKFI